MSGQRLYQMKRSYLTNQFHRATICTQVLTIFKARNHHYNRLLIFRGKDDLDILKLMVEGMD